VDCDKRIFVLAANVIHCFAGKAQIAESKHRLRRLLDEADDAVTSVRFLA